MNKKIKVIELFELIFNNKQIPQKILYDNEEYVFNGESFVCCDHDTTPLLSEYNKSRLIDFLKSEVEILEDNTEEIDELPDYNYSIKGNRDKINELVREVKQQRKINDEIIMCLKRTQCFLTKNGFEEVGKYIERTEYAVNKLRKEKE